jgi:cobalt/nickel transport system ATP-binding protein
MDAVVRVRGLSYRYDDGTLALNGIDFDLYRGETVAALGPNGSGKTTFALHLNGLLRGNGSIEVCGMEVTPRNLPAIRSKVGIVFQDSDEQLFMPTVAEDVAFGPMNQGLDAESARAIALDALAKTGMAHAWGKAPYHLSAGEKKRVALAGVLATNPDILVLDEPTTFLDPPAKRQLLTLLSELPQAKFLITHDTNFARALASRAIFFEKGRIAAAGSVSELTERFEWEPATSLTSSQY